MYPGPDTPHLGRFVKNAGDSLNVNGHIIELCVLDKVATNTIEKLYNYVIFYLSIFIKVLLTRSDCLYLHYASHCYLPVKLGNLMRRTRIIVHVHGGDVKQLNGTSAFFFRIKKKIIYGALKNAVLVIFPSKSYLDFTSKEYDLDINKCAVSPSGGVDTKVFSYVKRDFDQPLKMLYAGRLIKSKRVDLILQAIETLSPNLNAKIRLTIVGDGPELNALMKRAANLPNVDFLPAVGHDYLAEIFQKHDVLIYPSESESLGLVPLEAMATGMIPLLSDIPSFNEFIVDKYNGLICYDCNDYKKRIEQILSTSTQNLLEISHNAQQTVLKKYTKELAQKRLLEAFKCCL